jgi:hypothetical protein
MSRYSIDSEGEAVYDPALPEDAPETPRTSGFCNMLTMMSDGRSHWLTVCDLADGHDGPHAALPVGPTHAELLAAERGAPEDDEAPCSDFELDDAPNAAWGWP